MLLIIVEKIKMLQANWNRVLAFGGISSLLWVATVHNLASAAVELSYYIVLKVTLLSQKTSLVCSLIVGVFSMRWMVKKRS